MFASKLYFHARNKMKAITTSKNAIMQTQVDTILIIYLYKI